MKLDSISCFLILFLKRVFIQIENIPPQNEDTEVVSVRKICLIKTVLRGGPRAAAKSKMERFVIIVNGFQPLTIITKPSILDVAVVLDLPLVLKYFVTKKF